MVMDFGLVDIFSQKSGYVAAEGDVVVLSGDREVAKASSAALFPLGRVSVIATGVVNNGKLSIRTPYPSLFNRVAGENLTAGPVVLRSDDKYYQWKPKSSNSTQTITFAVNAAGDGSHTMVIDGVSIVYTPAAASTPTVTAAAVVALINANVELISKGFVAGNSAGVITLTSQGAANSDAVIAVSTTDTAQTVVSGGVVVGVGYDLNAVVGLCVQSTLAGIDAPVLVKE